jgi:hypothetical protein
MGARPETAQGRSLNKPCHGDVGGNVLLSSDVSTVTGQNRPLHTFCPLEHACQLSITLTQHVLVEHPVCRMYDQIKRIRMRSNFALANTGAAGFEPEAFHHPGQYRIPHPPFSESPSRQQHIGCRNQRSTETRSRHSQSNGPLAAPADDLRPGNWNLPGAQAGPYRESGCPPEGILLRAQSLRL